MAQQVTQAQTKAQVAVQALQEQMQQQLAGQSSLPKPDTTMVLLCSGLNALFGKQPLAVMNAELCMMYLVHNDNASDHAEVCICALSPF